MLREKWNKAIRGDPRNKTILSGEKGEKKTTRVAVVTLCIVAPARSNGRRAAEGKRTGERVAKTSLGPDRFIRADGKMYEIR